MPAISQGIYKQTRIKRQTAVNVPASGATGGLILRRKNSTFELSRDTYNTADEIASHQQMISERQGVQKIDGKLSGLVSPGTYSDLFSALLRKDFVAGTGTGSQTTISAVAGAPNTLPRSAGSYITDGIKVLDVVRCAGWTAPALANNAHNFLVTAVSAGSISVIALDSVPLIAKVAGDSVSISVVGKKSFTPDAGHTNIYYTVEEWDPSVAISEVSTDVKVSQASIKIPGNGNVDCDFTFVGLNQNAPTATAYFTAPAPESVSAVVGAATGAIVVNGVTSAIITSVDITIDGQETPADGVVGTRIRPDIFRKKVMVKGSISAYIIDSVFDNYMRNESIISIGIAMAADTTPNADFIALSINRAKLQASSPSDGEIGRMRTFQITALYDSAGGTGTNTEKTTISMQDSLA